MNTQSLPEIVCRAMTETVTDIGHLSKEEKHDLDKYVRRGALDRGKGGAYPKLKWVYAVKGFDFAAHREEQLSRMQQQL